MQKILTIDVWYKIRKMSQDYHVSQDMRGNKNTSHFGLSYTIEQYIKSNAE